MQAKIASTGEPVCDMPSADGCQKLSKWGYTLRGTTYDHEYALCIFNVFSDSIHQKRQYLSIIIIFALGVHHLRRAPDLETRQEADYLANATATLHWPRRVRIMAEKPNALIAKTPAARLTNGGIGRVSGTACGGIAGVLGAGHDQGNMGGPASSPFPDAATLRVWPVIHLSPRSMPAMISAAP